MKTSEVQDKDMLGKNDSEHLPRRKGHHLQQCKHTASASNSFHNHEEGAYFERVEIFIQAIRARAKIDVSSMLLFTSNQMLLMLEAPVHSPQSSIMLVPCRRPSASAIAFANANKLAKRYPYASIKSRRPCDSLAHSVACRSISLYRIT